MKVQNAEPPHAPVGSWAATRVLGLGFFGFFGFRALHITHVI